MQKLEKKKFLSQIKKFNLEGNFDPLTGNFALHPTKEQGKQFSRKEWKEHIDRLYN